ncbi:MAG: TonB-dependent receptor [Saprospiraceae bacterium]|nr:TonB-dependent receptor [Lewinella sp.]
MKKILILLLGVLTILPVYTQTSLSGIITDKTTGEPLLGAGVYLPDLKTGAASDIDGTYLINNLPARKIRVEVTYLGYKSIVETIDLAETNTRDFALEESISEIHEVIVTGVSNPIEKNRTPTPISTVSLPQLLQRSSTNIIDALAAEPGVSQVSTGAAISKPVIRGLGYNRVVVVNDGIRQEGQQWGDEHGIEIDEFSVNRVEILKGPASLSYGSDAMAGVVNFLSPPPVPSGDIQGSVLANYQTNNGLIGLSANLRGNNNGLIWEARYSNKSAHAYQNSYDGYVFNSNFRENGFNGLIGLNKQWGYSHLKFSLYDLDPGIVEGDRDSTTGQFVKPIALADGSEAFALATRSDFHSYHPQTPHQQVRHYKAVWNNSLIIGQGTLKATLGFQQNQRKEFAEAANPGQYGLFFLLNTFNYDIRYHLPNKDGFDLTIGANGMQQDSRNKGSEFLIPDYQLFDLGTFAIAQKSLGKFDLSGGLRIDVRNQNGDDLYLNDQGEPVDPSVPGRYQQFKSFHTTFTGLSGSVGGTYQISSKWYAKLNASRGFRAPNIAELGANGVHEGTIRYEIGNPDLKAENSLQLDAALGMNTDHVSGELTLFNNRIHNFIYLEKLQGAGGVDSLREDFSVFQYTSGNANLKGGELSLDIHPHPLDWLHLGATFSYVLSEQLNQPDSTRYLPFTPPAQLRPEVRLEVKKLTKNIANAYLHVELEGVFPQNHFYAANDTETQTPGYSLLDVRAGADVMSNERKLFSFYMAVNNLFDVAYQSHLSRLKYADENNVTGRTGVFNMGRNVSLKVVVPFSFKS